MADTINGWWPELKCDDCGKIGVNFKHWGTLTENEFKNLCSECMKKRKNTDSDS